MGLRVAVVGATGAVGSEMLKILEERDFPVGSLVPMASPRSAGKTVRFKGEDIPITVLGEQLPTDLDVALLAASKDIARRLARPAADAGVLVVDNSRAFRLEPDVPLVVPEVNPHALEGHGGLIANPNCSTIAFVVAIAPLHRHARLERATIATYQAVSGAGAPGLAELEAQTRAWAAGEDGPAPTTFPHPIAFNLVPRIDSIGELGYTGEEWKMVHESRKILAHDAARIAVTCVRVPVRRSHSLAIFAEFADTLDIETACRLLAEAPGVRLSDPTAAEPYPTPLDAADTDEVFVGRVRRDPTHPRGLALWAVMDQLRKGAASNAVQIAELALAGT